MKRIVLLLSAVMLCMAASGSEITTKLPSKCTAYRPAALKKNAITLSAANALLKDPRYGQTESGSSSHEVWEVFSDRDNNVTYVAPGSATPYKSLDFNEKVRIAQIDKGYALVYSEPKSAPWPEISSHAEWKGWIPMSNLLLWRQCLTNEKGIYEKAVICANVDAGLSSNMGKLFKNPKNTRAHEPLSINFRFYFIMKRDGRMLLLSKQNNLEDIQSDQVLLGWVDENSCVSWSQRSCLEPTWDVEAVELFAKNGVKVNIYEDASMKNKASYVAFSKKDGQDPNRYRMNGMILRYPILDNSTTQLWNCSSFSSTGKSGAINAGATEEKKENTLLKKNLDQLSNINIAIVIDGTKSMEKFYPAVRETISEFTSYFQKTDHVKVGVLIYRDKADGEYVTESFPMTNPNNPALAQFLLSGGKYGVKSSPKDKSLEEALYYGIDKALDTFQFKPEESNMLFVVGDCGNSADYPAITKSGIESKLVAKNVTVMGFQVKNESGVQAYTFFNNNVCDIISESLQAKFNSLVSQARAQGKTVNDIHVKAKLKKNSYEFSNDATDLDNSLYVGTHKYVQSGLMDINELKDQMISSVISVKTSIDKQRAVLVNAADLQQSKGSFADNVTMSGPVLDEAWLTKRIGKDMVDNLKKSNATVSFKGYTPKIDKVLKKEYYKTVVFLSREELQALIQRLTPLYNVAMRKGDDRLAYVQAMQALVVAMIPNIKPDELNALGQNEMMGIISGLNASTITLKGPSIPDILSPQVVSPAQFQDLIKKFKRQYTRLNNIVKQPYPFTYEFNGVKYYWIPTEDMP